LVAKGGDLLSIGLYTQLDAKPKNKILMSDQRAPFHSQFLDNIAAD
jgi:hypothetical protein